MSLLAGIKAIFTGGFFSTVENIATEMIETKKESAEAQTLMLKVLDPNGIMRRQLSRCVTFFYGVYLFTMLGLLVCEFFGFVPSGQTPEQIAAVTQKLGDLFAPITTAFGMIIGASFGVNFYNVKKGN